MRLSTFVAVGLVLLSLLQVNLSHGQETIQISEQEAELLGLEFKTLGYSDQGAGIRLPGLVIASPEISSAAVNRFSGVLEQWMVEPGERVETGQLLARVRSMEVMELQQEFLMAQTNVKLEEERVQRDEELLQGGIISQQRLQQSRGNSRLAEVTLESLAMRLAVAGFTQEQLTDLDVHDQYFGVQQIRSPGSGVLTHRAYSVGQYVGDNETIATISEVENTWLSVQVPGRLASFINSQSTVSITGSEERLTLKQRDFEINSATQTIEVLAQFNRRSNAILGQLIDVRIQPGQDTLFVPSSAVVFEGNDAYVYVQTLDGVEVRNPQLMAAGAGYLVQSRLDEGDRVLVRGAALVKGMQLGLGSEQ